MPESILIIINAKCKGSIIRIFWLPVTLALEECNSEKLFIQEEIVYQVDQQFPCYYTKKEKVVEAVSCVSFVMESEGFISLFEFPPMFKCTVHDINHVCLINTFQGCSLLKKSWQRTAYSSLVTYTLPSLVTYTLASHVLFSISGACSQSHLGIRHIHIPAKFPYCPPQLFFNLASVHPIYSQY